MAEQGEQRPIHIFICYAHEDREILDIEATWLRGESFAVWFDDRIHPGLEWADELAQAIDECSCLLFLASNHAVASRYCRDEIAYAVDRGKPILTVFLEPLELTGGLKLILLRQQAIVRWQLNSDEYRQQLRHALDIQHASTTVVKTLEKTETRILQLPISRNRAFSGRNQILDDLSSTFSRESPTAQALIGSPGVGKTQLALEYVYRHVTTPITAWIRAETGSSLDADFVQLGVSLGLAEATHPDVPIIVDSVKRWLTEHDNWFLVLDNVERPEDLQRYLPLQLRGNLLLTSRRPGWQRFAHTVAIEPFQTNEAVEFLVQRTGLEFTPATAELAETLGYLPLALEEAAAYLEVTGRNFESYLTLFREHHDELMATSSPPEGYPGTLRTTLQMALGLVAAEQPLAESLLKGLAFLGPDDIPTDILRELTEPDATSSELPLSDLKLDNCIATLRRYSLIKVGADNVSVHRLTQLVVRDRMSVEERNEFAQRVLSVVAGSFPRVTDMGEAVPTCRRLLPHALALLEHGRELNTGTLAKARLLGRTGTYLSAQNQPVEASAQLAEAYTDLQAHGNDQKLLARTCELYGRVLYANGSLGEAQRISQQSLPMFEQEGASGATHLMQVYVDLAWVQWTMGNFQAAQHSARASLELIEQQGGHDDPRRLASITMLARLHLEMGELENAREMIEDSTRSIESLGGLRSPLLCAVFLQMGQVLRNLGAPLRAQSWAQESLKLGSPVFSENHSVIAASHCVLGQALLDMEDLRGARSEFVAAATSSLQAPHPVNQDATIAVSLLVLTQLRLGETDQAQELISSSATRIADITAGESTLTLSYAELAQGCMAMYRNDLNAGLQQTETADRMIAEHYGQTHPYRLYPLWWVGNVHRHRGQIEEAEHSHLLALDIADKNQLVVHPQRAHHLRTLAELCTMQNQKERALDLRREALNVYSNCMGPASAPVSELQALLEAL